MCDDNITLKRFQALVDKEKSRDVIAKTIKCNTSTITKHYNGDRTISTEYIIKYSKYFNVSADYLLGLSDVATMDKDIKFVCDYTGLSEDAINELHQSVEIISTDFNDFLSTDKEISETAKNFSNIPKDELEIIARNINNTKILEKDYNFEDMLKLIAEHFKTMDKFYAEEKAHLWLISAFLSDDDILHEFTSSLKFYLRNKDRIAEFETTRIENREIISPIFRDLLSDDKMNEIIRMQKIQVKEDLLADIDYPFFKLIGTFKKFCENLWSELNNGND